MGWSSSDKYLNEQKGIKFFKEQIQDCKYKKYKFESKRFLFNLSRNRLKYYSQKNWLF